MVVAATGFFDGVHLGHKAVLDCLTATATAQGAQSAVITFWPHPRAVLQKDAAGFRLLTSLDEKRSLIMDKGVDAFHVLPFNKDFSQVSAKSFFTDYLQKIYHVDALIIGYNHRLGKDMPNARETMRRDAASVGLELLEVPEFFYDGGDHISSTKIRAALSQGSVETACQWLGYPYQLHGVVVEGNRIGRTMGFPTANMELYEPLKQLPANGVYRVNARVNGRWYKGMTNIGCRPTIANNTTRTIETHIFDFNEDIYGLEIVVQFLKRHRQEIAFPSVDALKQQLKKDKQALL